MIKNMIQTNHTTHHIPQVLDDYFIHENTLTLISARAIDHDIIAIEFHKTRKIKQTSLTLIHQACKKYA